MNYLGLILILAILAGQLVKIPVFETSGPAFLDAVLILLCLIGLVKLKFKLIKPPVFILFGLIFTLVAAISLVFTPLNLHLSEYLISSSYIIRFGLFIIIAWLLHVGALPKLTEQTPYILLSSGTGLAVLGILQLIFLPDLGFLQKNGWDPHYFRTVSTFLDPNFAGAFFALTFLLLHLGGVLGRHLGFNYILFIIIYLALLTTFSRSSYLMFLASGLTLSFLNKSLKMFIIYCSLFAGLTLSFYLYNQTIANPRNIDRVQSASFRMSTWQQGLEIWQKSPLLGVGFNAYRFAVKEYHLADDKFLESRGATSNDSSLLFVLSTTGIIGFISFLFFLGSLVWVNKKNHILLASLVGLLVQSFFTNVLFYPFILIWIILIASYKT